MCIALGGLPRAFFILTFIPIIKWVKCKNKKRARQATQCDAQVIIPMTQIHFTKTRLRGCARVFNKQSMLLDGLFIYLFFL